MEAIEARAFKPSLHREIALIPTQQVLFDDLYCATGINGVSGEDFSVDDLLDLSNGNFEDGSAEEDEEEEENDSLSDSSQDNDNSNSSSAGTADFGSLPADGLAVPVDDLADLEWLSHFVDDSVSEFSLLCPSGKEKTENRAENRFKPGSRPALLRPPSFPSPVPAKARTKRSRTKRSRTTGRIWSLGSPSLSDSSSSSGSSSSSTSCLIFTNAAQTMEVLYGLGRPPAKKQKKKQEVQAGVSQFQRRCSHCQVQKTPQWRTGPLGAKTLCNACGVRYKSGRLFPEYRPACSPTFSGDIHSNSHRKVLEIRQKKVTSGPESGLTQMVSSF